MPSASNVKTKSKINEAETKKEIGPPSRQAAAPFVEGCLSWGNRRPAYDTFTEPSREGLQKLSLYVHARCSVHRAAARRASMTGGPGWATRESATAPDAGRAGRE